MSIYEVGSNVYRVFGLWKSTTHKNQHQQNNTEPLQASSGASRETFADNPQQTENMHTHKRPVRRLQSVGVNGKSTWSAPDRVLHIGMGFVPAGTIRYATCQICTHFPNNYMKLRVFDHVFSEQKHAQRRPTDRTNMFSAFNEYFLILEGCG